MEYQEDFARAYRLGLLTSSATVVADNVLSPMAAELVWHMHSELFQAHRNR